MAGIQGVVYLLHFTQPVGHASHYLGWSGRDLPSRLAYHRAGRGSRLLRALILAGGDFTLVVTVPGDRYLERALKNQNHGPRFCPVCMTNPRPMTGSREQET